MWKGGVTVKKKLVLLTVTLLLVFSITQVAAAAGMGWDGGPHKLNSDKMFNPVEKLNLTDQQIVKMREINQKTYEQTRDLRIKMMDSRHELKQLKLQKNPDQAQIDAKVKEINNQRDKLHGIFQQSKEQCHSLLTQEQLEQVKQFKGNMGGGLRGNTGPANQ